MEFEFLEPKKSEEVNIRGTIMEASNVDLTVVKIRDTGGTVHTLYCTNPVRHYHLHSGNSIVIQGGQEV